LKAKVVAVCISENKGTSKKNVGSAIVIEGFGLKDDAHAGNWHRQASLLSIESIEKMKRNGLVIGPGDFGENITTEGLELTSLPIGTELKIGKKVILRVTQIGKICPRPCAIYYKVGYCIMPKEGIFAAVIKGDLIKVGDKIDIVKTFEKNNKEKKMFKCGIVTVSTSVAQGRKKSKSDQVIIDLIKKIGGEIVSQSIVPDEQNLIVKEIKKFVDELKLDLVLTTGGTGFSPTDFTPEATRKVIEREVPGIPEAMRMATFKDAPKSILSRSVAGIRRRSLIINLPGNPKGARECLNVVLPVLSHALKVVSGEIIGWETDENEEK